MTEPRRFSVLPRLGLIPSTGELVRAALDRALDAAEADGTPVAVLDAGCGRASALRPYRARIARFVGADIHRPAPGSLPGTAIPARTIGPDLHIFMQSGRAVL